MKQFVTPLLFLAASGAAMASLIPIGTVPESGTGLGAVNTVLTVQSKGSSTDESGCVGFVTGMTMTGSTACPGAPVFTGGSEQAQNHTYLSTDLGLTTFANLQLIFNGNEPSGGGKESITLTDLALTLWGTDGTLLGSFQLGSPYTIPDVFPGTGNAGYGFVLNAADNQLANADTILAANPGGVYIGAAITAANAQGGIDTVFIRTTGGTGPGPAPVPEPGTLAMMGGGLLALAFGFRRRLS